MPIIPNLPAVQGDWQQSAPSPSVAAAPYLAAAGVAQGVANLGIEMTARVQNVIDDDADTQARRAVAQAKAEHEQFRMQNPDETKWRPDMEERMGKVKETIDKLHTSPFGRKSLDSNFEGWRQSAVTDSAVSATQYGITKARQNKANLALEYRVAGDFESARATWDAAEKTGLITPEDAQAHRLDINQEEKTYLEKKQEENVFGEIMNDPVGWRERNPTRPEGLSPIKWEQRQDTYRSALRQDAAEFTDLIHDGMVNGTITSPEQIDEKGLHIRPAVRAQLKSDLASMGDAAEKARRITPEYQAQTVGQVAAMLTNYNPQGEGFDADFVKMDSMVRTLPAGAMKDELDRQLKSVREGKLAEVKTHAEAGSKALDEAYKTGRFGPIGDTSLEMPTAKALNESYLKDWSKLVGLGWSDEQASAIKDSKTQAEAVKYFRENWMKRQYSANTDGLTWATAMALVSESPTIRYQNTESEDAAISRNMKAQMALGRAKTEYANWMKLNPNATNEEIENKVFGLAGEEVKAKLKSGIFEQIPSRGPQGAADSTSALPIGKNLMDIVKNFEAGGAPDGFHRTAYYDVKQWSIGYGTKSKEGEVISKQEAESRLQAELAEARKSVSKVTSKYGISLKSHEEDALTSFTYNLGEGRLEELLKGGTRGKAEIATAMQYYRNAGGQRLRGLENRRLAEQSLFLNGYPGERNLPPNPFTEGARHGWSPTGAGY